MKRKILFLICSALLMTGCSNKTVPTDSTEYGEMEIMEEPETESVSDSEAENTADAQGAEIGNYTNIFQDAGVVEKDYSISTNPIKIEKGKQIFSDYGITIEQIESNFDSVTGMGIRLRIKNSNHFPVLIYSDMNIVNDITVDDSIDWRMDKGETLEEIISAPDNELEAAGYKDVYQISANIHIYDTETKNEVGSAMLNIPTENKKEHADTSIFGDVLHDSEYTTIYGKYVNNDKNWGTGLVLTVYNKSESRINAICSEAFADGQYMKPTFSAYCEPGTYAMGKQIYSGQILKENGQNDFATASVIMTIYSEETFDALETTETLNVDKA